MLAKIGIIRIGGISVKIIRPYRFVSAARKHHETSGKTAGSREEINNPYNLISHYLNLS